MRCYATETMTCVGRYIGKALKLNGKVIYSSAKQLWTQTHTAFQC